MAHPNLHPTRGLTPSALARSSAPRQQHLAETFGPAAHAVAELEDEENELLERDAAGDRSVADRLRAVQARLTALYTVRRASALGAGDGADRSEPQPRRRVERPALPSAPGMEEAGWPGVSRV